MKNGIKKYIEFELGSLTREDRFNLTQTLIDKIEKENWNFDDISQLLEETEKKNVFVRQPLFEKIIYPIIKNEISIKNVEAVKTLIKLKANLFAYQRKHKIDEYGTWNLVEKGLEFDGDDKELLLKYEDLLQNWLDYTIHHIPDFLIYSDFERTTPARCDELLELLERYKTVCRKLKLEADITRQDLIEECDFHFRNYEIYLQKEDEFKNYKDFLKKEHPDYPDFQKHL